MFAEINLDGVNMTLTQVEPEKILLMLVLRIKSLFEDLNAFIMSLLTVEKVGKTLRKYFFQILRHGLFSDANIKIERVKK